MQLLSEGPALQANANKLAEKLDLSMEDFRMQDSDLEDICTT